MHRLFILFALFVSCTTQTSPTEELKARTEPTVYTDVEEKQLKPEQPKPEVQNPIVEEASPEEPQKEEPATNETPVKKPTTKKTSKIPTSCRKDSECVAISTNVHTCCPNCSPFPANRSYVKTVAAACKGKRPKVCPSCYTEFRQAICRKKTCVLKPIADPDDQSKVIGEEEVPFD